MGVLYSSSIHRSSFTRGEDLSVNCRIAILPFESETSFSCRSPSVNWWSTVLISTRDRSGRSIHCQWNSANDDTRIQRDAHALFVQRLWRFSNISNDSSSGQSRLFMSSKFESKEDLFHRMFSSLSLECRNRRSSMSSIEMPMVGVQKEQWMTTVFGVVERIFVIHLLDFFHPCFSLGYFSFIFVHKEISSFYLTIDSSVFDMKRSKATLKWINLKVPNIGKNCLLPYENSNVLIEESDFLNGQER